MSKNPSETDFHESHTIELERHTLSFVSTGDTRFLEVAIPGTTVGAIL